MPLYWSDQKPRHYSNRATRWHAADYAGLAVWVAMWAIVLWAAVR